MKNIKSIFLLEKLAIVVLFWQNICAAETVPLFLNNLTNNLEFIQSSFKADTHKFSSSRLDSIFDPAIKGAKRLHDLHILGNDLSQTELQNAYYFLLSEPLDGETNIPLWHVLKNDLLNVLKEQSKAPTGLTQVLISMYYYQQDQVVKDYALQHLAIWSETPELEVSKKRQIISVLGEAAQKQDDCAGTALLGLHRLIRSRELLESYDIDDDALRNIRATNASCALKRTTLQICAERKVILAVPIIEKLAARSESIALRLSAISALVAFKDYAFLETLTSETNALLKRAITKAKIKVRESNTIKPIFW